MKKYMVTGEKPTCFIAAVEVQANSAEEALKIGMPLLEDSADWELVDHKPRMDTTYVYATDETQVEFAYWSE